MLRILVERSRQTSLADRSIALIALGVIAVLACADAPAMHGWLQEDGWVEWATAYFAIAAAVVAAINARRSVTRMHRAAWTAFALAALAFGGEEVSWGQRVFALTPPEAFLAHNFQQELNVHNMLGLQSRHLAALVTVAWAGALVVTRWKTGWPQLPFLAGIVWLELAYPFELAGEVAELLFALMLAWTALCPLRGRAVIALAAVPLLVAVVTPAVLDMAIAPLQRERATIAQQELESLSRALQSAVREQLFTRRTVHKRLFTASAAGYFDAPAALRWTTDAARRTYFVDPWGDAYWVWFDSKTRTLSLYSFGPNRRRDSRFEKKGAAAGGDDLMITLALPPPGTYFESESESESESQSESLPELPDE